MKSFRRASALVFFAAFLCFLPCASGQSTANLKVTGSGYTALNVEPPNFFALALTKGDDFYKNNSKKNSGCDGRNEQWGGKCAAVPEGGTSPMYLLLAALSCLGGMVLRSRRQSSMRQTD